jgi:hypothetical protein
MLSDDRFRVYTNPYIVGVELGGALKNVVALAVGMVDGLGFGDSAKAGVMTRGLAEISRLGTAAGAHLGGALRRGHPDGAGVRSGVHIPDSAGTGSARGSPRLSRIAAGSLFLGLFFGISLIYFRRWLIRFYSDFRSRR